VRLRRKHVFINCPFDGTYKPIFYAIVFTVYDIGFVARCALEADDAGEFRLSKIVRIIEDCPYGIHDISSVKLGAGTKLPRFNMPFEVGLYLGCKFFGTEVQKKKGSLIIDSEPYRYRTSFSDISGQDIHSHEGKPEVAISVVRNWLANVSKTGALPGGAEIAGRYRRFTRDLPKICKNLKRLPKDLTFLDFSETVEIWLKSAR
jgi:hypothetical protein